MEQFSKEDLEVDQKLEAQGIEANEKSDESFLPSRPKVRNSNISDIIPVDNQE